MGNAIASRPAAGSQDQLHRDGCLRCQIWDSLPRSERYMLVKGERVYMESWTTTRIHAKSFNRAYAPWYPYPERPCS